MSFNNLIAILEKYGFHLVSCEIRGDNIEIISCTATAFDDVSIEYHDLQKKINQELSSCGFEIDITEYSVSSSIDTERQLGQLTHLLPVRLNSPEINISFTLNKVLKPKKQFKLGGAL